MKTKLVPKDSGMLQFRTIICFGVTLHLAFCFGAETVKGQNNQSSGSTSKPKIKRTITESSDPYFNTKASGLVPRKIEKKNPPGTPAIRENNSQFGSNTTANPSSNLAPKFNPKQPPAPSGQMAKQNGMTNPLQPVAKKNTGAFANNQSNSLPSIPRQNSAFTPQRPMFDSTPPKNTDTSSRAGQFQPSLGNGNPRVAARPSTPDAFKPNQETDTAPKFDGKQMSHSVSPSTSSAKMNRSPVVTKIPTTASGEYMEGGATLAIVGGEPIFAADLMLEANQILEKYMAGAPQNLKDQQRKKLLPKLLKKYVESKLMYVDTVRNLPDPSAKAQMFKLLGDHFNDNVLPSVLEQNKMKSAGEFDAHLRGQGASLRRFRQKWIDDEFVRYFLKEKVDVNPDINHQEILDYYRKHEDQYRVKERARWEQIVITFAQIPDRNKARAEIAKLGNEIVYGASFEAVAKKSSHGLKAKDGGQQGWVNKGSLVSTKLDKSIFEIPLNRLSDIIETDIGFHIIRVHERLPAGLKPFRDAQVEIKARMLEEKRAAAFKEHLAKLKRQIPIEILMKEALVEFQNDENSASKK